MLYNPQLKGAYTSVPGVMGMILLLISAMMTSIAIVKEKELGTMEVLLVSPMKPWLVIISKVIPYFVISLINVATILILSVFVLGLQFKEVFLLLIFSTVIYLFCALAWLAHFYSYRYTASGYVNFTAWFNASGCYAKWLCFSNSKHAVYSASYFKRCPGKMVYHYC